MRFAMACSTALVLFGIGCSTASSPIGSEGAPCYGNGTCDGDLICASDLCVQILSCAGIDCSGFGTCEISGGAAECICDPGYRSEGLACVEDSIDPCAGQTCSGFGSCVDNGGTAECDCDSGYRAEGLECLFGEHTLSGEFILTDNFSTTEAFTSLLNQQLMFVIAFNMESSRREQPSTDIKELIVTTGPMQVELSGSAATILDEVSASLEGQPFELTLETGPFGDVASDNIVGEEAPVYFALEYFLEDAMWMLDSEGFPIFGPASGLCSVALRRYTTPFATTDSAFGDGTCSLE